ncbi:MAG: AAA family ATPase [Clostridia bacterium]|nr:AAA family ATPase [Clostridia bacterium]
MKYGCIGEKLGHSFSAVIHGLIGLYDYELCPVEKAALDGFMTRRDFCGINVTIPYKRDVIPYMEEISEEARLCGAVNTVVNRGGKLYGYNTDFRGMEALLIKGGISVKGKKVLILGSGGTSGTALALMRHLGAARVERVSRSGRDGLLCYEDLKDRRDTQILVNTTPCGMFPKADECAVSVADFPCLEGVADAVYNPLNTRLVLEARERGIPAIGGLFMLVAQALFAAEIFTGNGSVLARLDEIYETILDEKRNFVLTGMPGSGKSTLGRLLAERWGKVFFDSDEEIVKEAGISIPEIFRAEGEKAFRDRETEVIRRLSALQGAVIATGGGVPLREENLRLLKGNGTVIFLDAPLETLAPTADRPLSSNFEDLRRRYEERYGIYRASCDRHVPVSRAVEENLKRIEKELK